MASNLALAGGLGDRRVLDEDLLDVVAVERGRARYGRASATVAPAPRCAAEWQLPAAAPPQSRHAGLNHPAQHRVTALRGLGRGGDRFIAGGVLHHPASSAAWGRRGSRPTCRSTSLPLLRSRRPGCRSRRRSGSRWRICCSDCRWATVTASRSSLQLPGHRVLVSRLSLLQVGSRQDQHVLDVLLGDTGPPCTALCCRSLTSARTPCP